MSGMCSHEPFADQRRAHDRVTSASWPRPRGSPRPSRDLVRHAQPAAEFIVDEPGDAAAPVSLEARLTIELGRRECVLPGRGEDVPLPARVTHEHLALTSHDHSMFGTVRESILTHELVEHAGPHTASE